jgi:hypothetical protein
VGMRFNKWPIVEFVNFDGSDFRKHYQMELVTIVFLLSLRSLKNFITGQKLKIDSDGAQQLAIDIRYIIESICTSELLLQNSDNF